MKTTQLLALALVALAAPSAARAHGVEVDVERSAAGIAVRARYHGGRPLAGATYEVVSPAAPGRAHDEGKTDRHGWLAFVPDAPGTWTVRIVDASGHGKLEKIEVTADALAAAAAAEGAAARAATVPATAGDAGASPASGAAASVSPGPASPPVAPASGAREKARSLLRAVGGLAVIGLAFAALSLLLRRRAAGR